MLFRSFPEVEKIKAKDLQTGFKKIVEFKRALRERFRKECLGLLVQKRSEAYGKPLEVV